MEIKSYAGFTIGPIIEVLQSSKKTRELWFGSYFFSWYMERLYKKLQSDSEITFIIPTSYKMDNSESLNQVTATNNEEKEKRRIGFFPDHFIIKSQKDLDQLFVQIKAANDENIKYFSVCIKSLASSKGLKWQDENKISEVLADYLQTRFVVLPISNLKTNDFSNDIDSLILNDTNEFLNALELNRSYNLGIMKPTCYRCRCLLALYKNVDCPDDDKPQQDLCPLCLLRLFSLECLEVQIKLGIKPNDEKRYPSIAEISARDLFDSNKKLDDWLVKQKDKIDFQSDDFKNLLKENNRDIKPYHKYMAIVQADGDNLGKALENKKIRAADLTEKLAQFAQKAADLTIDFHGKLVYCGGDDLLAFIPVAYIENNLLRTVIDYVAELHNKYYTILNDSKTRKNKSDNQNKQELTISFGVSIFYYKFPLSTSLSWARDLLFEESKKYKNCLAMRLTKHSGQSTNLLIPFSAIGFDKFKEFAQQLIVNSTLDKDKKEIDIPHSLHHNLSRHLELLVQIDDAEGLKSFFTKHFNEPFHEQTSMKKGLDYICNWMYNIHLNSDKANRKKEFQLILDCLRFIKFLLGDRQ